ncbi:SIS domain-containing protein [Caproiciproducens galactitolivorans]|uniref:SIS domain-containing protein n=1 Tax=Caproiciproducens galactitolivorans TaxID=642589 RepID=A0ABT4BU21_9FIRM|nr:SIS domain-containing protein [Caproiciproducens galactitolivorans]MCY1713398.1 SIS domain-containing protein [Caproiciproducens galactitolivorans]
MLKFNEAEYRNNCKLILDTKEQIKSVADEVTAQGFKNLFLVAVGGTRAVMLEIGKISKQLTTLPVYIEQASELVLEGNKNLSKDSIVITMSKSGDTKETVAAAKWCKEQDIRVIAVVGSENSLLQKYSDWYIPNRASNDEVEFEYVQLLLLFFRLLHNRGEFDAYDKLAEQLEHFPDDLVKAKEKFDPRAAEIAKKYYSEPYIMFIGGGELWCDVYLFSMCIMEEMQWIKTKSVTSAEFFHGSLELVDDSVCVFLVKGEGKTRALDERAERFLKDHTKKLVVIDTKDFALDGIDESFRWFLAPLITSTILTERLSIHFEANTKHDLSYRRYYRQFDY